MSQHEYEVAKSIQKKGDLYKLYRVGNILTENITLEIYEDLSILEREAVVYKIKIKK